ncbi:MAG: hypothetical protein ACOX47_05650 [Bacillota bacterium]
MNRRNRKTPQPPEPIIGTSLDEEFWEQQDTIINLDEIANKQLLYKHHRHKHFTMQFGCGNCCKKVSNILFFVATGNYQCSNYDFGLLAFPPFGECLKIETFCHGRLTDTQIASQVGVQVNHHTGMPIIAANIKMKAHQASPQSGLSQVLEFPEKTDNLFCRRCHPSKRHLPPLLRLIDVLCDDNKLAVQYTCGDYLKKTVNIDRFEFNRKTDVVTFSATEEGCIVEKMFCGGKLVDADVYKYISIPFKDICSIECGAVEICEKN